MSKPLLLKLPEYVSVCILPGRLVVENRVGLGAMAMGAVLEIALGIDILKVEGKKQGRQPQIPSFDSAPAAGGSDHLAQGWSRRHGLEVIRLSTPEYVRAVLWACWPQTPRQNIGGPCRTVTVPRR